MNTNVLVIADTLVQLYVLYCELRVRYGGCGHREGVGGGRVCVQYQGTRPALSTPLEHTALTWQARSHRRPRFLMFAGVSLLIEDSPLSGAEARAFQRVWVRTPPEPALCARGQHVIVPVQS